MKPAIISRALAISGTTILSERELTRDAYVDSITIGEGHLDATDLLPTGGTRCETFIYPCEPDIFAGYITSCAMRPGVN